MFYLKGFVFLFDKKDVSAMLQRGTARTVVGNWGQGSNGTEVMDLSTFRYFLCL